jgi:hypothetical protein
MVEYARTFNRTLLDFLGRAASIGASSREALREAS